MDLTEHAGKEVLNNSTPANNELPLQLKLRIMEVRNLSIFTAIQFAIFFFLILPIPWAIFYTILTAKLNPEKVPNRKLIKAAIIVTLPMCLFAMPLFLEIYLWRIDKKLKEYEENGPMAFISDKEFLEGEPKRKRQRTIILIIVIPVLIFLIAYRLLGIIDKFNSTF